MDLSKPSPEGAAAAVKQSKPAPATSRIVPVIPLKMTKAHDPKQTQRSKPAVEQPPPEQGEASESTSRNRQSSPSASPTASISPDSSLAQESSGKAVSSVADSPALAIELDPKTSFDPIPQSNTSTAEKTMISDQDQFGPRNDGHMYSQPPYGIPGSFPTGNVIMPTSASHFQPSEIPTTMASVINSFERTALSSPGILVDSFERAGPNVYYGPPDVGVVAPSMMPPNVTMGYDYSSPHPMMQGPPMGWGFPAPMNMPPPGAMGPSYGVNGNGTAISRSQSHTSSNHENGALPSFQVNSASFRADPNSLQEHVKTYWRTPQYADFTIQFVGPFAKPNDLHLPVHAIVVRQSPYISALISDDGKEHQPHHTLTVSLDSKFLRAPFITTALSFLYGHSLPSPSMPQSNEPSMNGMMWALQSAAAGQLLEMLEIMKYGFHHAVANLSLSTVELALGYLQWSAENVKHPRHLPLDIQAQKLLADPILKFLAETFPVNFELNRSAPELKEAPRFPMIQTKSRPSMSNPALAQIQFGQIPVDDVNNQNMDRDMIISSILLSLDTMLLEKFFQESALGSRIGWGTVAHNMRDVVDERETRRLKAIKAIKLRNENDWTVRKIEVTKWKESVCAHQTFPSGFTIFTRRIETD